MTKKQTIYSEYWLDQPIGNFTSMLDDKIVKLAEIKDKDYDVKVFFLANIRRTINKLVNILSGKTLNVTFSRNIETGGTDGKNIILSSKIHKKNLDSTVGLALHEATHCVISDFDTITNVYNIKKPKDNTPSKLIPKSIYDKSKKIGYDVVDTNQIISQLLNWVEDRRIDYWQFMNSPGYKGYYKALYKRFFFSRIVSTALKSPKYRTETTTSYFFRIINLINKHTDLDALKGLRAISDKIDLKNIKRLQSTNQALIVAIDIFDIMLDYIIKENKDGSKGKNEKPSEMGGKSDNRGADDEWDPDADIILSDGSGEGSGDDVKPIPWDKLSDKQKKQIEEQMNKMIQQQKNFLQDGIKKEEVSSNEAESINIMSDPETTLNKVNVSQKTPYNDKSNYDGKTYDVIVMRGVNDATFFSKNFPFSTNDRHYINEFEEGENLGRLLASKLRIRNEERELIYNRMTYGKIDKRRLASYVGCDAPNVFQQRFVEKYCDSILHISIDVSSSMHGPKLGNAIIVTTAICKAASIIKNLDVVVSLRGTTYDSRSLSGVGLPVMAIIYDSRVDKYEKVRRFFPNLTCSGTTPEGLCFAAIQEEILSSTQKLKSYFCNLSDGEPYYNNYTGEAAAYHTMEEIKKMRLRNIKILSYFIKEGYYTNSSSENLFRIMYGQDAKFIDVRSIIDIAKTLNDLFLEK